MKKILFVLQGHPSAKAAAEFSIDLAKRLGHSIVAEYAIDRTQVCNLEQFTGETSLCGSGAFLQAENQIIRALAELAESMMTFFRAVCEGQGVMCEHYIEVGEAPHLMSARAKDCAVIVVPAAEANVELARELMERVTCPIIFLTREIVLLMPKNYDDAAGEAVLSVLEQTGRPIRRHDHIETHELLKFVPASTCIDDVTYSLTAKTA